MKVTQVAIRPTEASDAAGRPALTPELLAASGARYSRNNEGLESILAKIDPTDLDKSVDAIFRMIDYGHQSIADMAPVAMFIDGISIWLAYYVWSVCPTAGGQESSTRYIKMSPEALVPGGALGVLTDTEAMSPTRPTGPTSQTAVLNWPDLMAQCFEAYKEAYVLWKSVAENQPEVVRIPERVLADPSDRGRKQAARMRRNYGFDRARYYLPAATATNVMLVMSARGWTQLCQCLLSHPLPEATKLGALIQEELAIAAPRMLRHATAKPSVITGIARELQMAQAMANAPSAYLCDDAQTFEQPATAYLEAMPPVHASEPDFAGDLTGHDNRYAWIGPSLRMTPVRFGWEAVALAEIRDLNRHRTGSKFCSFVPQGFYSGTDELAGIASAQTADELRRLSKIGRMASEAARRRLQEGDPAYVYWTLLGTQLPFEHVTTADKFIYEAELRTGVGAHYRYAKHLRDALTLWYDRHPQTRGLILEGEAEPE